MAFHIVLTTFGSLGDLHPSLALGLELQARGHRATIATSELYRAKVETLGLGFHPTRPDLPSPDDAPELISRVMDLRRGTEFLAKEILMPALRNSYDDLCKATQGADLLVTHPVTLAAPLVARKQNLRWVSTALAPFSLLSEFDPPVPPIAPALARLYKLGEHPTRAVIRLMRGVSLRWVRPVLQLRDELGLPDSGHPFFEGGHSPLRHLALFSKYLAAPQSDWPPQTRVTGFAWYDRRGALASPSNQLLASGGDAELAPAVEEFLRAGDAPIVWTLGSSAVMDAGDFFRAGAVASQSLGRRAILLAGSSVNVPKKLPDGIAAFDYVPHGAIFPRAAAIVHQGGVGTTGQAMRSGVPQLVMPYSHDQPDNAARIARLGVGRTLPRNRFNAVRAASELQTLLDESYARAAAELGEKVRAENGVQAACDAIEQVLAR